MVCLPSFRYTISHHIRIALSPKSGFHYLFCHPCSQWSLPLRNFFAKFDRLKVLETPNLVIKCIVVLKLLIYPQTNYNMKLTNQYVLHRICHHNVQSVDHHCRLQYLRHAQHYNHQGYDRPIGKTNIEAHFLHHGNRHFFYDTELQNMQKNINFYYWIELDNEW